MSVRAVTSRLERAGESDLCAWRLHLSNGEPTPGLRASSGAGRHAVGNPGWAADVDRWARKHGRPPGRPISLMRLGIASLSLLGPLCTPAAEANSIQWPRFSCAGGSESIQLPSRLSQVRAMAPLQRLEVVHTEQWDGYKAIEIAYHFPGLVIGAVTFTNEPERYHLSVARISDAKWRLSPFRIGQRVEPHLRRWGVTGTIKDGTWRIHGETDRLVLEVRQGRIVEFTFECYTG